MITSQNLLHEKSSSQVTSNQTLNKPESKRWVISTKLEFNFENINLMQSCALSLTEYRLFKNIDIT